MGDIVIAAMILVAGSLLASAIFSAAVLRALKPVIEKQDPIEMPGHWEQAGTGADEDAVGLTSPEEDDLREWEREEAETKRQALLQSSQAAWWHRHTLLGRQEEEPPSSSQIYREQAGRQATTRGFEA